MTALHTLGVAEVAALVQRREVSPVEVVTACLTRLEALEPTLQAWVTIDRRGALAAAKRCEQAIQQGDRIGALAGVPVGLKDIIYTAGLRTAAGSRVYANFVPTYDATVTVRLQQAGAVILGKTVTTEFATADPSPTRNPWNIEHTPGGSSSGSAASVAARIVPAALGSQTGGSTLRPASYCGIVGLKPTYGRISRYGVIPVSRCQRARSHPARELRHRVGCPPHHHEGGSRGVPCRHVQLAARAVWPQIAGNHRDGPGHPQCGISPCTTLTAPVSAGGAPDVQGC